MRRKVMMAGVLAAILALAGCSASGPSKADVASVEESLATMPPGWSLVYVDGGSSSTEGLSRYLSIGAKHRGEISDDDLSALVLSLVDAVPSSARYKILFTAMFDSVDEPLADITAQARDIGLDGQTGMHESEIYGTRAELKAALEARP